MKEKIAAELQKTPALKRKIALSVPERFDFGHYSTAIAFEIAEQTKKNPYEVAEDLAGQILEKSSADLFEKVEAVRPGFINFWLKPGVFYEEFKEILKKKNKYGAGRPRKDRVQVEFISANPTGPLTLANGRGGFFGDVLANILAYSGYKVEREFYVNDTGNQIINLGKSISHALGFIPDEESFYKGGYVKEWALKNRALVEKCGPNYLKIGQSAARDFLKATQKVIQKKAGIRFDRWTSEEKDIHRKDWVIKARRIFEKKKLVYEKDNALWLKTTKFGDDKDRVLITSDGFPTYFLADAGHYLETKARGFKAKINILGPDHHSYAKRIQIAVGILKVFKTLNFVFHGNVETVLEKNIHDFNINSLGPLMVSGSSASTVVITQAMRLVSGGKETKMSKRRGEFVTFEDLIDDVGTDVARFFFLMASPQSHMDFDMALAKERSNKNPVYYSQYAYVRASSILEKAKISAKGAPAPGGKITNQNLKLLNTEEDLNLIRKLVQFPEIIEDTAGDYQIHRLTRYAGELARAFHNFYEKERVLGEEKDVLIGRLALTQATKIVLENLFGILGISTPERM